VLCRFLGQKKTSSEFVRPVSFFLSSS
jgi:hypothetical protein